MRTARFFALWLAVAALAACGTTGLVVPTSPAQAVYQAHGNYAAGLAVLLQYKALPDCAPASTVLCKDPAKLKELLEEDEKAFQALSKAQAVVRGDMGPAANQAARDAEKAIAAFRAKTATVKVQP